MQLDCKDLRRESGNYLDVQFIRGRLLSTSRQAEAADHLK